LTPSAFRNEMSLTTKQRLASTKKLTLPQIVQPQDKCETSHHKFSAVDPEQSSLQPCPPEVVFQNYTPGKVYEMPVLLRNRDKVPQQVKVTLENSPYFQLAGPNSVHRKVPPGLSTTVCILFTPEQNKASLEDYFHQLLCISEREEFIVPIRAIGARAILDLPDQLDFLECPVKYSSKKTLLVRNLGNREAHYQMSTQSPFSVIPAMGTLGIGDTVEVTVGFQPLKTGDYSASLVVCYDTGESTHTSVNGRAVDVPIGLDRKDVTFEKTYITLSDHTAVHIHNLSDITARFQWKAQEEQDQLKLRQYHGLCRQENDELSDVKECRVDTTHEGGFALLTHSLWSERAKVRGHPMLFTSDVFSLEPKVSGRENRLLLRLEGEGLGPQLHFRFEELDIGTVVVRAAHRYEVILLNSGLIEAPFSLVPPTTAMGCCFTFLPWEGIVAPGGLQPIQISFSSTILGEFKEVFSFCGTESPKPLSLTIRGFVMGPTFHFNVPALHFGDVSFGFPYTLRCHLSNTSLAPMAFNLRIPEDGTGELSVSCWNQLYRTSRASWTKGAQGFMKPREFYINPCEGIICPLGSQDIEVTLCSNTVGEYKLELVVDVDGVGERVLALPLTARCIVPPLQVLNPLVRFHFCCLKVPYTEKLTLLNDSDVPGCYRVLPQEHKEKAAAWYCSSAPSGIIKPHSSVEIPLTLEAQLLGECRITAEVAVFGSKGSPLEIRLECIGQGPVVYVTPREINFGPIQVLQDSSKRLYLANQCDAPATFRAEMAGKHSCWRIEPSKGVVPPNSEVAVIVTANLNDTVKFVDEVKVFIENSPMTIISVQAVGIGTTIVTDKPLAPKLDFKHHFSFTPCRYEFTLTNKGRRMHRLYWTTEGFRIFRRSTRPPALGGTKSENASQIPRPGSPVFKMQPYKPLSLRNTCSLPLSIVLRLKQPFMVCDANRQPLPADSKVSICGLELHLCIQFNPAYERGLNSRVAEKALRVCFVGHPHEERIAVRGEVYFPNLHLQAKTVDFGCIMNDTKQVLHMEMTNCSPIAAQYYWSFQTDSQVNTIRYVHLCPLLKALILGVLDCLFLRARKKAFVLPTCLVNISTLEGQLAPFSASPCSRAISLRAASCSMQPTVLVFQELSCTAVEPQWPVRMRGFSQFPEVEHLDLGIEEVFDVLPLWGVLPPGQSQLVTFSFFGHANIVARVTALCHVEGGPTHKVALAGAASCPSYQLDVEEIDWGLQVFNQVLKAKVTLRNTGVVKFTFVVPNGSTGTAENPLPGVPVVVPTTGSIAPGKEQVLKVYYLSGRPRVFCRTFQVQVAHLEPSEILLKGEGTFPRITVHLPWMS
ncbi:HYDIN protein, partial [Pteruthius melanotis]|nr:HYDIN protein [Pteruthius melanotis]